MIHSQLPSTKVEIVNHLLTTEAGKGVLDAAQGSVIDTRLNKLENQTYVQTVSLEGNRETFYPCMIPIIERVSSIEIIRGQHDDYQIAGRLRAKFRFAWSNWAGFDMFKVVDWCVQRDKKFLADVILGGSQFCNPIIYLRGGHSYWFYMDFTPPMPIQVYYVRTNLRPDLEQVYHYWVEPTSTVAEKFQTDTWPAGMF